jgi:chemotaxis protein MotB
MSRSTVRQIYVGQSGLFWSRIRSTFRGHSAVGTHRESGDAWCDPKSARLLQQVVLLLSLAVVMLSGCHHRDHRDHLTSAQSHARDLYAENQLLLAENEQANQLLTGLDYEKQALMSQLGDTQGQLATANERLNNLMAERNALTDRFARVGDDAITDSGISSALEAAGFEYDPATGLNKFRSDILFDLGSDGIRQDAQPIIKEFASAVVSGTASGLRILVVGHTDDQSIVRPETAQKHPTNWHLSTDRSDAVILELLKHGVPPERIASMGYSEFHPLEHSTSEPARQRNRRVELFVVPNSPEVARWDPVNAVR